MLKRIILSALLFFCSISTVFGAFAKVRMSVQPFSDTTPPVITISLPASERGIVSLGKGAKVLVRGTAIDDSGVASVLVNGTEVVVDDEGHFVTDVILKPGQNKILVVALDLNGNRTINTINISRQAGDTAIADSTAPLKGRSYALIIGINDYKHIQQLTTAVNDANKVASLLKSAYGFETTLLINSTATRVAISKEIARFKKMLNPEDRFLIYYAGHGHNDKETETSFWMPVDADQNEVTDWLPTRDVTDELRRCKARQILIVSDSCYSGTISRAFNPNISGDGSRENYLLKLMSKPSRVLIASGGNEPVADGTTGHSPFALSFIKSLENPFAARFTAEELLTHHIKESVAGNSLQTPQYKIIQNSGHDSGDFVFEKMH